MFNFIVFSVLAYAFYRVFKNYVAFKVYSSEAFKNFAVSHDAVAKSDLGLFVALVAKVAKADGRVDALEAELVSLMFDDISKVFPEPEKTRQILKDIFNEEKSRTDNIEETARAFAQSLRRRKAKQIQFMGFLIQLAFADGEVSESEEKILQLIAEALEFDPKIYHAIFDRFESGQAREVLARAAVLACGHVVHEDVEQPGVRMPVRMAADFAVNRTDIQTGGTADAA